MRIKMSLYSIDQYLVLYTVQKHLSRGHMYVSLCHTQECMQLLQIYFHIMDCSLIDASLRTLRLLSYRNSPYPSTYKHTTGLYCISIPLLCRCQGIQGTYSQCICDTVPPCRLHVHMFTIIQFLRVRANIHTVIYCIQLK